jgi:N-acetyl-anhydromuramyl-L-alanine amidase AmpD
VHRRTKSRRRITIAIAGGTVAVAAVASLPLIAQATSTNPSAQADFTAAANKYHVPRDVLMGVAHEVSGWQSHKGYNDSGGYGLAGLTDVTPAMMANGEAGGGGRADLSSMADHPELHTVRTAAKLTGISASKLKNDRRSNLMGEAALLASYQKKLTGGLSEKPSDWAGAVAKYSQITDKKAATNYVHSVFGTIKSGAKRKVAGSQTIQLPADPSARPATGQLNKLKLRKAASSSKAECPPTVDCTYAPLSVTGSNGQKSDRPSNGVKIDRIVLHTAEGSFDSAMKDLSSKDAIAGTHYLMSSDGATTQLMANKDIAFSTGNYHYNLHSISIEHEGFSARGADWYTDAAYQQTAKLVTYLAHRFNVPLDHQHILGHDNVPGSLDSNLAAQHWDPGTAWDWNRFMRMLNAPDDLGPHRVGRVGSPVTIAPAFDDNKQTYNVCPDDDPSGATSKCTTVSQASNSLFVRSAPSSGAPLFRDPVVNHDKKAGTNRVSDWSDRVQAGQQFVVADREGAWTAIWYDGKKGWIYNPNGKNTVPANGVHIIKAAAGSKSAPVYGQAYPAAKEYPAGSTASKQEPLKATNYAIPAGQAYVADQPADAADDYDKDSGAEVKGSEKYYQVQFNNRTIYVNSADVTDSRGW